jgi:hypothetical protein
LEKAASGKFIAFNYGGTLETPPGAIKKVCDRSIADLLLASDHDARENDQKSPGAS